MKQVEKDLREIGVKFKKYRSAKQVAYAWWEVDPQTSISEVEEKVSDLIEDILAEGYWGFCRPNPDGTKTIHYWTKKGLSILKTFNLIAHEVTHAAGIKSEKVAVRTASIATFALFVTSIKYPEQLKLFGPLDP